MSTLMKFEYLSYTLQFLAGGDYPANYATSLMQVQDRTAAGTLQVENLGITIKRRTIVFTLMPKEDYDALENWFLNVVVGGSNSFFFTDEYGITKTVKIIDPVLDFTETSLNRFSGSITVEYI